MSIQRLDNQNRKTWMVKQKISWTNGKRRLTPKAPRGHQIISLPSLHAVSVTKMMMPLTSHLSEETDIL